MMGEWRIFLGSVALLAVAWVCLFWQGICAADALTQQENRLHELRAQVADLRDLQDSYDNLEVYQLEVAGRRDLAAKLLPDEMETAELLASIKKTADISGMELKELVPDEVSQGEACVSMPIRVKLSGDYFSLLDFLRRLQNGARLVQIDTMDLAQYQSLECQLGLKVFAERI